MCEPFDNQEALVGNPSDSPIQSGVEPWSGKRLGLEEWRAKRELLRSDYQTVLNVIGSRDKRQLFSERYQFGRINLSRSRLRGADLENFDLRGVDFSWTDLREANLQFADLRQAKLIGVDLRGARLRGANLCFCQLDHADLRGAGLRHIKYDSASYHYVKWPIRDIEFHVAFPEFVWKLREEFENEFLAKYAEEGIDPEQFEDPASGSETKDILSKMDEIGHNLEGEIWERFYDRTGMGETAKAMRDQ